MENYSLIGKFCSWMFVNFFAGCKYFLGDNLCLHSMLNMHLVPHILTHNKIEICIDS